MRFYLIYSIDVPKDERNTWEPNKNFKQVKSYKKPKMISKKYVGELNKDEFNTFLKEKNLIMTPHNTMGGITDKGWFPAMEFLNKENVNVFAYVTPLPKIKQKQKQTKYNSDRNWTRLKKVMLRKYGAKTDLIY